MQPHDHHHHHPDHRAHLKTGSRTSLAWALVLTFSFALVEALTGWWSGSLALLGDAGHMVSDSTALGMALFAAWIAQKPPSATHTYGLGRLETLTAFANGLLMLAIVVTIVLSAIARLQHPQTVQGGAVMGVATLGLLINIGVLFVLSHGEQTLNTRGALLHVMGDLLGSVAAILSGAVIYFTGWMPIDPILSIVICALILTSSINLLRESLHVILEGVPTHLHLRDVGAAMAQVPGIVSVHDLHIWTMGNGQPALSAHVVIGAMAQWPDILAQVLLLLDEHYHVEHVTLQPELLADMPSLVQEIREPRA
jgi:cobalt-zinc-cadmium efflux system protein